MSNVETLHSNSPFLGTWVSEDGDSSAVFSVTTSSNGLLVSGIDREDGEKFIISEIKHGSDTLEFLSEMPSTGHKVHHVFTSDGAGAISHQYTLTERWVRESYS